MTTVLHTLTDTDDRSVSVAVFRWTPSRRIVVGGIDRTPAQVDVTVIEGTPAPLEVLPASAVDGWCWEVREHVPGAYRVRHVLVPDSPTPVAYRDLVDVDPRTLTPTAQPEAAWAVALAEVRDQLEQLAETGTTVDLSHLATKEQVDDLAAALRAGGSLWDGNGAPPDLIVGAKVGDYYLDRTTGALYKLGG